MESLLLLIPFLVCPLMMAAIGAIGWLWAKREGGADRSADSSTDPTRSGQPAEPA